MNRKFHFPTIYFDLRVLDIKQTACRIRNPTRRKPIAPSFHIIDVVEPRCVSGLLRELKAVYDSICTTVSHTVGVSF